MRTLGGRERGSPNDRTFECRFPPGLPSAHEACACTTEQRKTPSGPQAEIALEPRESLSVRSAGSSAIRKTRLLVSVRSGASSPCGMMDTSSTSAETTGRWRAGEEDPATRPRRVRFLQRFLMMFSDVGARSPS